MSLIRLRIFRNYDDFDKVLIQPRTRRSSTRKITNKWLMSRPTTSIWLDAISSYQLDQEAYVPVKKTAGIPRTYGHINERPFRSARSTRSTSAKHRTESRMKTRAASDSELPTS